MLTYSSCNDEQLCTSHVYSSAYVHFQSFSYLTLLTKISHVCDNKSQYASGPRFLDFVSAHGASYSHPAQNHGSQHLCDVSWFGMDP